MNPIIKTSIHSASTTAHSLTTPFSRAALPVFFALAFLPAILNLLSPSVTAMNPLAALGPVIAGFWVAATVRHIRVGFMMLGPVLATLLWAANWFIMAGKCCSTIGN